MATIKCIGCYELSREEMEVSDKNLVVYICRRFFPYYCHLSGLLRPARGLLKAVEMCPEQPLSRCVLCQQMTDLIFYGKSIESIASMCSEHNSAWSKWLNEHPERSSHLAPKGRSIRANWVEVFREFIEDMRPRRPHGE